MRLTGKQYQEITQALLEAFPFHARLAQLLRFRLEKNLDAIAMGHDLQEIVFKLVGVAEAEGWVLQLIQSARESNPGNPLLISVAKQFDLTPIDTSNLAVEKIIKKTNSFLDVNVWRTRLGEIETQVCRVEIAANIGKIFGTGFLIGPGVIITNYHVMESVILGERGLKTSKGVSANARDVILRFDYKRLPNGATLNPGNEYILPARDWLIDYSPNAKGKNIPSLDELDYALLRVKDCPGHEPVGKNSEPGAQKRGWIEVPTQPYMFNIGSPLFIMQHPKGDPLKLAIDTDAIIGVNENHTLVTYRTNTLPGSSGSPCFSSDWELIAIHHSGDPDYSSPSYNAGTPFTAIINLLEKRGLKAIF